MSDAEQGLELGIAADLSPESPDLRAPDLSDPAPSNAGPSESNAASLAAANTADAPELAPRRAGMTSSSAKIPALRLHRSPHRFQPPQPKQPSVMANVPAPRLLWLGRLLVGLALLALAWGGLLLAALLAEGAWDMIPHQHPTLHIAFYLVQLVAACWLGMMSLACIVTGAFSLAIGLTSRGWQ